jgi:hypothetical protein
MRAWFVSLCQGSTTQERAVDCKTCSILAAIVTVTRNAADAKQHLHVFNAKADPFQWSHQNKNPMVVMTKGAESEAAIPKANVSLQKMLSLA